MTGKQIKKSGSGKASRLTNVLYEKFGDSMNNIHANDISIHIRSCPHNNDYFLCQQCEARIRNQDILDRIQYLMDKSTFADAFSIVQDECGYFVLQPKIIGSTTISNFSKEFNGMYYERAENGFVVEKEFE